jgi:acyl carrier protein
VSTFERVRKVIVEWVDLDPDCMTLAASWVKDLGFDHHDPFELALALMEEFQMDYSFLDAFERMVTVGDLVAYLEARVELSSSE